MKIKKYIIVLLTVMLSCKNVAQKSKVLKSLPSDISNKTWIYLLDNPNYDTYKKLIKSKPTEYYITEKNIFKMTISGTYEDYPISLRFDSVIYKNNTYHISFTDSEIVNVKFKWIDKNKGIGEWAIKFLEYSEDENQILIHKAVDKNFLTPENFPEKKEVLEDDKLLDEKYEKVDRLPVLGQFSCTKESQSNLLFRYREVKLEDCENKIIEKQPYEVVLSIDKDQHLSCILKKIKGSQNKYALFFSHLPDDPCLAEKHRPYSKTRAIQEIEILNDTTIRNKWIGMYNRLTKKTEPYTGYYYWDYAEECKTDLIYKIK